MPHRKVTLDGIRHLFMQQPFALPEVKSILQQLHLFRVRERYADEISWLVTSSSSCSRSLSSRGFSEARREAVKFNALSKASAIRSAACDRKPTVQLRPRQVEQPIHCLRPFNRSSHRRRLKLPPDSDC